MPNRECARMIATEGGEPPSPLDSMLALQWALSPTILYAAPVTVTREEVVATILSPGAYAPAEPTLPRAPTLPAGAAGVPTPEPPRHPSSLERTWLPKVRQA